jgi:hypothetical protein
VVISTQMNKQTKQPNKTKIKAKLKKKKIVQGEKK